MGTKDDKLGGTGCSGNFSGDQLGSVVMSGNVSGVGVPKPRKMSSNSSVSEDPGKSGRPLCISAKMHPMDHTSTGVEYVLENQHRNGGTEGKKGNVSNS